MINVQSDFSRFLESTKNELHFAAHSHHFWPDVTFQAQLDSWKHSAKLKDHKWESLFSDIWSQSQDHLSKLLSFQNPNRFAFAPNTHELLFRLISCFELRKKKITVLTTDSEFHSAFRQFNRLIEAGLVEVTSVSVLPFDTFEKRFSEIARKGHAGGPWDLIYVSHVFFDSGFVMKNFSNWVKEANQNGSKVVLDGYHAFMALPLDLSEMENDVFYLAGGYKYAMAGEGACFMSIPGGPNLRPMYTGWFSDLEHLASQRSPYSVEKTLYSQGGSGFLGATQDLTPWWRFNSVQMWLKSRSISVKDIHDTVMDLQREFLNQIKKKTNPILSADNLLEIPKENQGAHFLTFQYQDANKRTQALLEKGIWVDHRFDRLRVGFGLYQSLEDVSSFIQRL